MKKFNKKSLGQNFLKDKNIIKKITSLVNFKDRNVIEIGPGEGALTNEILAKDPKSLLTIEKDDVLSKKLEEDNKNNKIYKNLNCDILKLDLDKLNFDNTIIIGNLPYNISSQVLVKILRIKKWPPKYSDVIFMFQKELGEKILGKFLTYNYGRISILTNHKLFCFKKYN